MKELPKVLLLGDSIRMSYQPHANVSGDVDRYLAEDQLHLSEAGKRACAEAVARCIEVCL